MLIIALALAVIGLAALVFAVVTSNALVAWVCIAASALGVILLTVDALRDRSRVRSGSAGPAEESPEAEPTPATPDVSEPADDAEVDADELGEVPEPEPVQPEPADSEPAEAEPIEAEPEAIDDESAEQNQDTD